MLRRNWRAILIFSAIFIDSITIVLSGFFAYYIRSFIPHLQQLPHVLFILSTVFFGILLILFATIFGVYRAILHSGTTHQLFLAGKAYLFTFLSTLAILYTLETITLPRIFTFLFFLVLPVFFILLRYIFYSIIKQMQKKGYGIHNTLLAGYDNGGLAVIKRFKNFPELGYNIKGVITNKQINTSKVNINGMNVHQFSLNELEEIINLYKIDRAFVPATDIITNGYLSVLEICKKKHVKLKVLSADSESLLRYSHIKDIAGITLYSPPREKTESIKRIVKRLFDLVMASIILIVITPVLILTSIAILLESGMPIFFKQKRASIKKGKIFYFYKFRSMIKNADEMKESLFDLNETDGALFKIKDDPRLTRVGRFIRRYSIDELPQLINVLKGDMSIVGPRPLPIADFGKLNESKEYWNSIRDREKVKPGITGLWQVSGRSKIGFKEMILLDLYYVENQSLLFDIEIIFSTIPVVLFGKGAY